MRWRAMLVAILVAASGVAASVPLIPGDRELAFLRFKDRLYDTARVELERRLAEGDLSVGVVRPLAELHLQYADVDAAILLLERFVAEHPDDLAARRVLGTYYQFGQRPFDYLRNLEQIAARQPSDAVLRELAEIYSWMDQPDEQAATLARLAERGSATTGDLLALARLRAARGRYAEAIAALDRADAVGASPLDEDGVELLASLLVDAGQAEAALGRMARRAAVRDDVDLAVRIARVFHGKGHPDLAARLLASSPALEGGHPAALAALAQAEVDAGLGPRALARLTDLHRQGRLPGALLPRLIELAAAAGDLDTAWSAAEAQGWAAVPPPTLGALVAAAHAKGRTPQVQALLARVGDDCLSAQPVLAAQLAIDRSATGAAAHWVSVADATGGLRAEDQAALASVERSLGRHDAAFARIGRHLAPARATPWAVEIYAQIALDTGRVAEALPALVRLRGRMGPEADAAWARVATAAGEARSVEAWLRSRSAARLPAQALRDIAYLAIDRGQPRLALVAARRLPAGGATRDDQLLIARALTESGDAGAALDVLRPLATRDARAAAMFEAALAGAAATSGRAREELARRAAAELAGPAVTPERRARLAWALAGAGAHAAALDAMEPLVRADRATWLAPYLEAAVRTGSRDRAATLVARELDRRDLDPTAREALVRTLIDLGASRRAEPHLRELAEGQGGAWVFVYDEALSARGDRGARLDLWRGRGRRADLAAGDRRAAAFRLLELRDKAGAEQILRALAEADPADEASLSQLLHLWGPRPPRPAIDWIEARARAARGDARAAWLGRLVAAGAASRVLSMLGTMPSPAGPDFDAWVSALRATRDAAGVGRAVEHAAAEVRDAARLDALARIALEESQTAAAERAFAALVTIRPDALEPRRWLGLIATARNDLVAAREHLEHYVAGGGRDPEALLRHGELLERDGRAEAARRMFAMGLEASARADRSGVAARKVHAFLLAHAGRDGEARRELDTLVAERPADTHLRADYASWLMKEGRHAAAGRVLDLR